MWLLVAALALGGCPKKATLHIVGNLHDCPPLDGFSVQPLQQEVGSDILLVGENSDAGARNSMFRWSQTPVRGRFADAARADTTFTCTSVGSTKITLEVSDGASCNYASTTEVSCVPIQLCSNQRLDPGEACDGLLSPGGTLPRSEACAPDCKSIIDRCKLCENDYCRDYRGMGTDLLALCFEASDGGLSDRCAAVVSCARASQCAYGPRGAEACYCGAAQKVACKQGQGVDGPCRAQLEAAANTTTASLIVSNLGNLELAAGRAELLLQCDRDLCPTTCVP